MVDGEVMGNAAIDRKPGLVLRRRIHRSVVQRANPPLTQFHKGVYPFVEFAVARFEGFCFQNPATPLRHVVEAFFFWDARSDSSLRFGLMSH